MMLNLYVQQHQWIVITLLSGAALVLLFCLTYSAMWRPRGAAETGGPAKRSDAATLIKTLLSVVPWVLVLLALASASFTILTLLTKSCKPPNW